MTIFNSFAFSARSSAELFKLSQSSAFNGGGDGAGGENGQFGGGGGFRPPPLTTFTQHPSPITSAPPIPVTIESPTFESSSSQTSSSSTIPATTTTATALLSSSNRPPPPVLSGSSTQHTKSVPLGLIIGASVGGMVFGALLVTFWFFWRRRRARSKARRSQLLLGGKQDPETGALGAPLVTPFIVPPAPNVKVTDWIRRNTRNVSVSTISSFSSPTIMESLGERSSISAYSQSSASRGGTAGNTQNIRSDDGGTILPRPGPALHRINE
ncbi:hypothetical protein K438DRAFT_1966141 [Mycena galopus ATCC 62051]|nr:hypothetical protein K438DRAFT_1966141 [Mycena galopus ATCC 62051]